MRDSNSDSPRSSRYRPSDSDDVLVRACLNGDFDAWDTLIDRYHRFIFSVAVRRGLTRSDAEDVFQNVCLKLYEHLTELRDVNRLAGWLASVTMREAAQLFRKETPRPFSETETMNEDVESSVPLFTTAGDSPEDELLALERVQIVRQTMEELSQECRKLLSLLYASETTASYNEIAERMEMPLGSIGPRRARCLARLRTLLERHGY